MTEELQVKEKDIVTPGDLLAKGMGYLPGMGTYREGDEIRASKVGLVAVKGKVLQLIPLSGAYVPKEGDKIVAKVIDIMMSGWRLDTRSPYSAVLSLAEGTSDYVQKGADLTQYFEIGDYVITRITKVTTQKLVDVSMRGPGLKKLTGGRIVTVNSTKVPRIIGKDGSMVSMVKQATGCNIMVGQNGWIWISGEPAKEVLAVEIIKEIEAKAHISGLTDMIKEILKEKTGITEFKPPQKEHDDYVPRSRGPPRRGPPRRGPLRGGMRGPPRRGPPRRDPPRGTPRQQPQNTENTNGGNAK